MPMNSLTAALPSATKTITAKEWNTSVQAYLWTDAGHGRLLPVRYIRPDWWIVTGLQHCTNSWCCHPGTILYIPEDREALDLTESILQQRLSNRRQEWAEMERKTWERIRKAQPC